MKGTGLRNVRLYLENGPTERWRSQSVAVADSWSTHRLRLQDFDHQTRAGSSDQWRKVNSSSPGQIERFSFKLGSFVNEIGSKGEVDISDLRLEP